MDDRTTPLRPICEALEPRLLLDGGVSDVCISDGAVAWRAWDGHDYEIFMYDDAGLRQLTDNQTDDDAPQVDGGRVVWEGFDGQDYEIYVYDAGVTVALTDNYRDDRGPQISGDDVVWLGGDGQIDQVTLHDLSTGTVMQLSDGLFDAKRPRIADGNVVWYAGEGNYSEIFLYDGSEVRRITDNSFGDYAPSVSATHVVWRAADGDDDEIFLYDIEAETTVQITDNDYHDGYPGLTNATVVFSGKIDGDREIFAYNIATQETTQLTDNDGDDWSPRVSPGGAIWVDADTRQIWRYSDTSGLTSQITVDDGPHDAPVMFGDQVVWAGDGLISMLDVYADQGVRQFTSYGQVAEPLLSVADVVIPEGAGPGIMELTVRLSGPTDHPVTLTYATAPGSATAAAGDYTHVAGSLTLLPGEISRKIRVEILGDLDIEADEHFSIDIGTVTGAILAGGDATVTLTDDDTPDIYVDDATVIEGDDGTVYLHFNVWLSRPIAFDVEVDYETLDGTATLADGDYTQTHDTLRFTTDGPAAQIVTVEVDGDDEVEPHETITLSLSNPSNAAIADGDATGTIANDDTELAFAAASLMLSLDEGKAGANTTFTFTVELSQPSAETVTVAYATGADPDATDLTRATPDGDDDDYEPTDGILTFLPGEITKTITVTASGDDDIEFDETFAVLLSDASGAELLTPQAIGEIFDDDAPRLTIENVTVLEKTGELEFVVTLDKAGEGGRITVYYATAPDEPAEDDPSTDVDESAIEIQHADSETDYTGITDPLPLLTFTFDEDDPSLTQTIRIPLIDDFVPEDDETFRVVLSGAVGAKIFDAIAVGTIENDDTIISIDPESIEVRATEGDAGSTTIAFEVRLSHIIRPTVSVRFVTADGTTTTDVDDDEDDDYHPVVEPGGLISFARIDDGDEDESNDVYGGVARVTLYGDSTIEENETFTITLIDPINGTLGESFVATGVIVDDDTPRASIADASIVEGPDGSVARMQFTVTLSKPNNDSVVTIHYATVDDVEADDEHRAVAGIDYTAIDMTTPAADRKLTFEIGEVTQTFTVDILGDDDTETAQTFLARLTHADGALLDDGDDDTDSDDPEAIGTIENDDTGVSIADASVTEGTGPSPTEMLLEVSLSEASAETVTVWYMTRDGDGGATMADNDYTPTNRKLTFNPGETVKIISVPVIADNRAESAESFEVRLYNPHGAEITTDTAVATIIDDDIPWLTVSDPTVIEGAAGETTQLQFIITVHGAQDASGIIFDYDVTEKGSASAGTDFQPKAETEVAFPPGDRQVIIFVDVYGDDTSEPDETLTLTLSNPANAVFNDPQDAEGVGVIRNDDAEISIAGAEITEGDDGVVTLSFVAGLTHASAVEAGVTVNTADGSAIAGDDYDALTTATLTFAPGEIHQVVSVDIHGDRTTEANETFDVVLSAPVNAIIKTDGATATGTITNDDDPPVISAMDGAIAEGDIGSSVLDMLVTLSNPSALPVKVKWATADATAEAGSDYRADDGELTFAPGVTEMFVHIVIDGDTTVEPNQTFGLILSYPENATIGRAEAVGTIGNDDTQIFIGDASIVEGDAGQNYLKFEVTLSGPTNFEVRVAYDTAEGTAIGGGVDYYTANGELTFEPQQTSLWITVPIVGDTITEPAELFVVDLSDPINAVLGDDGQGRGTIEDNDDPPLIYIYDATIGEMDAGSVQMTFNVELSNASASTVTVQYATGDGTAFDGEDYQQKSGMLTFDPQTLTAAITVTVLADDIVESNEEFWVSLSAPQGGALGRSQAAGTITDDDTPADLGRISIADTEIAESDAGTTMTFTVSLDEPAATTITVEYVTVADTAIEGVDYYRAYGTVEIPAGQSSRTITVQIAGDTIAESDERFFIHLTNPTEAMITDAEAIGTIVNDDQGGELTIDDASIVERDDGVAVMEFIVRLSEPAIHTVTVNYATADGTARADDGDYMPADGMLTFNAGDLSKTVWVYVFGDTVAEADETIDVTLSAPTGATLAMAAAVGVILNDDPSAPAANLTPQFRTVTLKALNVPGEKAKAVVRVTNTGDLRAKGRVTVRIWGSTDAILDAGDTLWNENAGRKINLAPGRSAKVTVALAVTPDTPTGQDYFLLAEVIADAAIDESDLSDNIAVDATVRRTQWRFGRLDGRNQPVTLKMLDESGAGAAMSLTAGGWGELVADGDARRIVLHDTTERSIATIAAKGGAEISVSGVSAAGPLKALKAATINVAGDVDLGYVRTLKLADVSAGTIRIGDSAEVVRPAAIRLRRVADVSLLSSTPLRSVVAAEWLNTDETADLVSAPALRKLHVSGMAARNVAGHFHANVDLADGDLGRVIIHGDATGAWTAGRAGNVTIKGDLRNASITLSEPRTGKTSTLKSLTVKGDAYGTVVRSAGTIGPITLRSAVASDFLAGLSPQVVRAPAASADFIEPSAKIKSFTITGVNRSTDRFFADTNIAAASLGPVRLLNADFADAGLYARGSETGAPIKSIKHTERLTGEKWSWPTLNGAPFAGPDGLIQIL